MNEAKRQGRRQSAKEVAASPANKRPYHHGDLKDALIAAALELVDKKGPRGFSLAEVCRQAEVSVAAPYRHFEDKESLLAAVAQSGFALFQSHLEKARAQHADLPFESIRSISRAYIEFAKKNPSRFRVMFSSELRRSRFPELYATAHNAFEEVLATIAQCRDPEGVDSQGTYTLAVSMWSQCHGIAVLAVDGFLREISMEHRTDELLDIACDQFIAALGGSADKSGDNQAPLAGQGVPACGEDTRPEDVRGSSVKQ